MKVDDVTYVLEALGSDDNPKRSGDHLMFNCPSAPYTHSSGEDSSRKLGVLIQPGKALVNCFYPGCVHGTLLDLIAEVGGKRVGDKLMTGAELSDLKAFVIMAEEDDAGGDAGWASAKTLKRPVPDEVLQALGKTSSYWQSRGILATQFAWKLGETADRALIPFMDPQGEVLAVQGRLLPGKTQDSDGHDEKYRTWPVGWDRGGYLVGEHLTKKPVDFLLVVESPVDALLLNELFSLPRFPKNVLPFDAATDGAIAVATMGGKYTQPQVQKALELVSVKGELCLGFDRDHAGRLAQRKFIEALQDRHGFMTEVAWVGKDPSDDDNGTRSLGEVYDRIVTALRDRQDWLSLRLAGLLTKTP